ncbi:MAG: ParA family protein, partial [Gammaproteobacteria bacterium]|nr:ParA family protein [Gammaproteobacteria bacterium]
MIITITNTKGGVGKTTLAANLGGYLADLGKRVLAVDADIQPTLSSYYLIEELAPNGLSHLITEADVTDVISRTTIPNL